ncbi:hypothetical protein EI94DRAFT_1802978 [Lactarius quietus]|nr:hypothetical protein EI94DRAFT_1802978 [Lactarius quietus]
MADSSAIPPDIARITAPILFGPMFNWALYGVLCVQTYVYSYNFPDDRRAIKFLGEQKASRNEIVLTYNTLQAYFVFLIETVQTALTGGDIYYWFIAGFGDLDRLRNSRFSAIDSPTIDAFISLIVQGFFCYRIWTMNKRMWWLCLIIAIVRTIRFFSAIFDPSLPKLSVAQATGAAWGGVKSATLGRYAVIKAALYLWLITSAVVDVLIAVAMTLLLRRTRGNDGRISNYVFPRVVRLTVETNALTATVAIVSFVLYVAFPNEIYYTCPTGVIGKLYSNTLLVTLNNRIYFRDHPSPESSGDSANNAPLSFGNHGGQRPGFAAQFRPSQSTTSSGTSIRLHGLPPSNMDAEKGKSDFVITSPVIP